MAQSFWVPEVRTQTIDGVDQRVSSDGVFVTSGEVYFKSADDEIPVTVQIRTIQNGIPTGTIVAETEILAATASANLSTDGSAATPFSFSEPVYLQSGYWYALILKAETTAYNVFISRMGEEDLITKSLNDKQPTLGLSLIHI